MRLDLLSKGAEGKSRNRENNIVELTKLWDSVIFLKVISYSAKRALAL